MGRVSKMNDRAPMQHGDVIFSLTDKPQENVGEPLSLRTVRHQHSSTPTTTYDNAEKAIQFR